MGRVVLVALFLAALLSSAENARAADKTAGELGATLGAGAFDERLVAGGEARAGLYFIEPDAVPVLLGNRFGFDVRFRALYGRDGEHPAGHFLLGAAPSLTQEWSSLHRRSLGVRAPSIAGLVLPEAGLWFRTRDPARFFLSWRAPFFWLADGEAGFELAPSVVWAPAGGFIAMASVGGFLR